MRSKLVSIQTVNKLQNIPNADKIEVCILNGLSWKIVVKKGQVKKGDKVVYFEIDSALPIQDRYEFLRSSSYKCWKQKDSTIKECFRLRTIRLRGVVSQGLVLPITMFPELTENNVGDDVTQKLNVKHYDQLKQMFGKTKTNGATKTGNTKGDFPNFLVKSDQERIQNLMSYFETKKDICFTAQSKYDGSSCTVYMVDKLYDKDQFGVCSRNFNLKRPCNTKNQLIKQCLTLNCYPYNFFKRWITRFKKAFNALTGKYCSNSTSDFWNIIVKCNLEQPMRKFFNETGRSIALQGQYVGPGVNNNRDKYDQHHYFIYDVYDVDNKKFLDANDRHKIINKLKSYNTNSIIEEVDTICQSIKIFEKCPTLQDLLNFVDRNTLRGNKLEGVVFKSIGQNPYFSFKCINNNYLLQEKD